MMTLCYKCFLLHCCYFFSCKWSASVTSLILLFPFTCWTQCLECNPKCQLFTHFLHIFQDPESGWDYWRSDAQALLREALPRATAVELWEVQADLPHRNGQKSCLHLQDKERGSLAWLLAVRWNRTLLMDLLRRVQQSGRSNQDQHKVTVTSKWIPEILRKVAFIV